MTDASPLEQVRIIDKLSKLFRSKKSCASIRCLSCQHSARVVLGGTYDGLTSDQLKSRLRCSKCNSTHGEVSVAAATLHDIAQQHKVPTNPKELLKYAEACLDKLAEAKAKEAAILAGEDWISIPEKERRDRQKLHREQIVTLALKNIREKGVIMILPLIGIPVTI